MMCSLTLKERKTEEQAREAEIRAALTGRKKHLAAAKRLRKQKKKPVADLMARLALRGMTEFMLRPAETYVPKSHNLDKQLAGLVTHLFVRYPVPPFLHQVCLAETALEQRFGAQGGPARAEAVYKRWFLTLAQGGSFPKAVKGTLTSREACAFLAAPSGRKIHENVWWARMKVAGLPDAVNARLIDRVFTSHGVEDADGRLAEAVQFYARHQADLSRSSFDEVTDFVAYKLRHDRSFRLKGRTASSAVKLSNEWHLQMQRAKLGRHIQWRGLGIDDWTFEEYDQVWEMTELKDNKELVNEGRTQKHCVYSYVQRCAEGRSFIFSLRACRRIAAVYTPEGKPVWDKDFETRRVTIEVDSARFLVQVRGPLNRAPTVEEAGVLRRWMVAKNIMRPEGREH